MSTPEEFDAIDHDAVLDALSAKGLSVSWEYPGIAAIEVTRTVQVWTGLHSYAYGDINVFSDMTWQSSEEGGAEPEGLDEYETDPDRIAWAWVEWVVTYRASRGTVK